MEASRKMSGYARRRCRTWPRAGGCGGARFRVLETDSGRTSAWTWNGHERDGRGKEEWTSLQNLPLVTGDTAGHCVSRRQGLQLMSCFSGEPEGGCGGRTGWLLRPPGPCWPGCGTAAQRAALGGGQGSIPG